MNIGKGIILMLMLLTFVGQAYASVIMPYSMSMGMSTSTMSQHSMSQDTMEMSQDSMQDPDSAHSGMSHTMTNDEQQDCCKSVCNCAMGSCFSVALTMALPGLDITTHPLLKMSVFKMTTLNQYPSSLYRPPILA
ncbi:CopL family metal-binding regulatory protein [Shewanella benthica]|uniref:CopL family metal-binding regulatory protein n=1 Tax=Shewanella benthica TaxID=43661 RepID=UPI001D0D60E2|nr:CopL family metal-binding regulatory protein [Shewanella benthica]MBE7215178.1 CopL family metal-binding regulatory protein [Shewanella benthica]